MERSQLIKLTEENFESLLGEGTASLILIGANWCGSYHMMSEQVSQLANEFKGKLQVHHVDFDNSEIFVNKYGVSQPPAILFFYKGQLIDKIIETTPRHIIRDKIIRAIW